MNCPACGAHWTQRDYAPPRSYALMLLGIAMILLATVLDPDLIQSHVIPHMQRVFIFGIVLLLYGFLDTFRHANRFCTKCGYRFRIAPGMKSVGAPVPQRCTTDKPTPAGQQSRTHKPTPTHTPIPPLLKCLTFKNEAMRRDAAQTLREVTGEDYGMDPEAWSAWWEENKATYGKKESSE